MSAERRTPAEVSGPHRETYTYEFADGTPAFRVKRLANKKFVQEHKNGSGWARGRNGTAPVLYRLPQVLAAVERGEVVYVVEGEKDVHAAEAAGVVATTNPGGAGKWDDDLSEVLAGARVVVVVDRDDPGRSHAHSVGRSLSAAGAKVDFRRALDGKDLSDHIEAGFELDELVKTKPRPKVKVKAKPAKTTAAVAPRPLPSMFHLVVLKLHEHAKRNGLPAPTPHGDRDGYEACCPAHDDRTPSLGVWAGDERAIVLKCQADCDPEAVVDALGIDWAEFSAAPRFVPEEDDVLRDVRRALALIEEEDERADHLGEALDLAALFNMPAPEWLVDGYLPSEGIAVIYGPEGVGKTLVLGSIALAVAAGIAWYGRTVNPDGGAPVLFYAGESAAGLGQRWGAWMRQNAPETAAKPVEDWDLAPFRVLPEAINLENPYEVARVVRSAREMSASHGTPVGLVAFDSFIEFLGGDNEGESLDKASRAARVIAQLLHCCVLIGHHPNSAGLDRGTRHLSFRAHSRFRMERWDGSGETWLVAEKQREGERKAMQLALVPDGDSVAFQKERELTKEEFDNEAKARMGEAKEIKREARTYKKRANAEAEVLAALPVGRENAISQKAVRELLKGSGTGTDTVRDALSLLREEGSIGFEVEGQTHLYWKEES